MNCRFFPGIYGVLAGGGVAFIGCWAVVFRAMEGHGGRWMVA